MNVKNEISLQIEKLKKLELCSKDLVINSLQVMEEYRFTNAFVAENHQQVINQAKKSDERREKNCLKSYLDGIPIAVKDNFLTKDFPTTACSNALPMNMPIKDAFIVDKLKSAGAIVIGKTNMHEWAYGATNTSSSFGPTKNPYNQNYITGGSSGGSAAAVSSGVVGAALGSDTGGSVRIPASACGIYGYKPSYGRASRDGILPLSWSLDSPGILASSINNIELLVPFVLGMDKNDSSILNAKEYNIKNLIDFNNLNLVMPQGDLLEANKDILEIVKRALKHKFITLDYLSLKHMESYFASWEVILHCEASSYHKHIISQSAEKYGSVTRAHLEAGFHISACEYLHAQKIRTKFKALLNKLFLQYDAMVLPTLPVKVPQLNDRFNEINGKQVSSQDCMTWFCWIANLAGIPAISIPCGKDENGLPVGLMIMTAANKDEKLIMIAKKIDSIINKI